jgi:hypothetical protein
MVMRMPRRPRIEKVLALAHKLASDVEGLFNEVVKIRGQLMKLVTNFEDLEPLVASVSSKTRCMNNGQCYNYLVLRVRKVDADFIDGIVLEAHVTRMPEIGDLVVKLTHVRNVYSEWIRATERLLSVLEETPSLLNEYESIIKGEKNGFKNSNN